MKKGWIKKGFVGLTILLVLNFLWPTGTVMADELSDLKEQLKDQQQKLSELQQKIVELESRQRLKEQALTEKLDKVEQKVQEKPSAALPDSLKWAEKIKWSGDFRYRYEYIDKQGKAERHRNRIRARLGLAAELNDEWDVFFRIATGERDLYVDVDKEGTDPNYATDVGAGSFGDPISTNQTLDGFFSSKDIWLDLGYFGYHPVTIPGLDVYGGKVKNPFYRPGKNQLIWDSDLNPEGISAQYAVSLGKSTKVNVNGGGFWVEESSSGVDTSLWGIQGYVDHAVRNPDHIIAGVSYFAYDNIRGRTDTYGILGANAAMPGGGAWASDYDIFEVFAEYGTKLMDMPISIYGDYAKNTNASTNYDTGWLIGGKINKAKTPGSWEISYDYRDLEADAVLAAFTDSDFVGGGIGGPGANSSKGHRFGFAYQVAKNVQAAVTYFDNEIVKSISDTEYRRLQADLKLKF